MKGNSNEQGFHKLKELINFIKKVITVSVVVLSLIALGIFVFLIKTNNKVIWIDSTIEEISNKNKYIEVVKLKNNMIKIPEKNCMTYKIKLRTDSIILNQPFSKEKYIRTNKQKILEDREKIDSLCSILENIDKGVPASYITEKFKSDNPLFVASSVILEVINKTSKSVNEIHLFVKGYADASQSEWSDMLEPEYNYKMINYYPVIKNKEGQYVITDSNIQTHELKNGSYKNVDLPLLRSQFVHNEYLKKLKDCSKKITKTGILQGKVINEKSEYLRNTEVYITACYSDRTYLGCSGNN